MELKERVIHTVVNNLMLASSFTFGSLLMFKVLPWLISSGVIPVNMVMK